MRQLLYVSACVAAFAVPFASFPVEAEQRFTLNEFGTGYILLDTDTGAISQCRSVAETIICELAVDDRKVLEDRISHLEREVEMLRREASTGANGGTTPASQTPLGAADGHPADYEKLSADEPAQVTSLVQGDPDTDQDSDQSTAETTDPVSTGGTRSFDTLLDTLTPSDAQIETVQAMARTALDRLYAFIDDVKQRFEEKS